MYTVLAIVYKRPDLTREEFVRHWVEVHTPLFRRIPGLRRYEIFPATLVRGIEEQDAADGFSIVEFDSAEAFEAGFASPEAIEAHRDSPLFVSHTHVYSLDPHSIIPPGSTGAL